MQRCSWCQIEVYEVDAIMMSPTEVFCPGCAWCYDHGRPLLSADGDRMAAEEVQDAGHPGL
jgi:hypothetical protein